MKVTQDKGFNPITVVFETREEAMAFRDLWGDSNQTSLVREGVLTTVQYDILHRMWDQIDGLLEGKN